MSLTTLNLHVQACESNNHHVLIMESRFKKITLDFDIHMLTWNAQLNIHGNKQLNIHAIKEINSILASMHK